MTKSKKVTQLNQMTDGDLRFKVDDEGVINVDIHEKGVFQETVRLTENVDVILKILQSYQRLLD